MRCPTLSGLRSHTVEASPAGTRATVPRQADSSISRELPAPDSVHAEWKSVTDETPPLLLLPMDLRVLVQDFAQGGITGTESRLARSLEVDYRHPNRTLITTSVPV